MAQVITTGSIINELRPGVAELFGFYDTPDSEYKDIFTTQHSNKFLEIEVEFKGLDPAVITAQGAAMGKSSMGQRLVIQYIHKKVTQSYEITKEAIQDNLYPDQFPMKSKNLVASLRYTKNTLGASLLNNAFDAAYPGADGQPICSRNHPIDSGTFANTFNVGATMDFSEAAVEQALIQIADFRGQNGMLSQQKARKFIIPMALSFKADRLLGSKFRIGTANSDINAIYNMNSIPEGSKVNHFLDNRAAWFIITDATNGLKHYQRSEPETNMYADPDTMNLKCSAYERYSFGISNLRALFGSEGA